MQFENLKSSTKLYILLAIFITPIVVLSVQVGVHGEAIQTFASGNINGNPLNVITGQAAAMQDVETTAVDSIDLQKGLIGYWRFDESRVSRGYSLEFDGINDYVETTGLGSGFSDGFSFSYWTRPIFQGSGNYSYHISYESGTDSNSVFRLEQDDDANGELDFGVHNNSGSWVEISSTALKENEWNYVGGRVTSTGTMELFVNGKSQGTATVTPANDAADYLEIAGRHGGVDNFNGKLDEIRIYNSVLTSSEIQKLYHEKPVFTDGLVLSQDFNEGPKNCVLTSNRSCLTDNSIEKNSGTPYGFENNKLATGSGWTQETPLDRLKVKDYSGYSHLGTLYGGKNGSISGNFVENWEDNSSDGWTTGCGGEPTSKMVDGYLSDYAYWMNSTGGDGLACTSMGSGENYDATAGEEIQFACKGYGCKLIVWNGTTDISSGGGTTDHRYVEDWKIFETTVDKTQSNVEIYFYNDNQVGHWVAYDVISEGPIQTKGRGNKVSRFDGKDDHLGLGKIPELGPAQKVTISAWVYPEAVNTGDYQEIFGDEWTKYLLGIPGGSSDFVFSLRNSSNSQIQSGGYTFSETKKWYHVTGVANAEKDYVKLYLDGNLVSSNTGSSFTLKSSTGNAFIGSLDDSGNTDRFRGSLDDVRIYSRALSSSQVKSLYNGEGVNRGLVGRWSFDKGDNKRVYDTSNMNQKGVLGTRSVGGDISEGVFVDSPVRFNETFAVSAWAKSNEKLFGRGSDGSLTVSNKGRIVNNYTYVDSDVSSPATKISVENASGFRKGQEVLLIQMQNGSTTCNAGAYEFRTISKVNTGELVFEKGIKNNYCYHNPEVGLPVKKYLPQDGNHTASVAQVVTVPHYTNVKINSGASITAPYWNGTVGGIVAFKASESVNTLGKINVKGKGFRGGGAYRLGDDDDGGQGEGFTGWGIQGNGSSCDGRYNNNGIGGGGSLAINNDGGDGAAGGGYGTEGFNLQTGNGNCNVPIGGGKTGSQYLKGLFFGGGGGGGSDSDDGSCSLNPFAEDPNGDPNSRPNLCQRGGHGGGVVFVSAKKIENANISAKGHTTHPVWDGGPGGGAGGTIWLKTLRMDIENITAQGGPEICDHKSDGSDCGGAGGSGRIKINTIQKKETQSTPKAYRTSFEPNILKKGHAIKLGVTGNVVYGSIKNKTFGVSNLNLENFRRITLNVNSGNVVLKVLNSEDSRQLSSTTNLGAGGFWMGKGLQGSVDEVRLYNRSLSQKEVQRLAFQ